MSFLQKMLSYNIYIRILSITMITKKSSIGRKRLQYIHLSNMHKNIHYFHKTVFYTSPNNSIQISILTCIKLKHNNTKT